VNTVPSTLEPRYAQTVLDELNRRNGSALRLSGVSRPSSGLSGSVYVLHIESGHDLVLRLFDRDVAAWKPDKERVVYALLRQQGVPAPRVLHTDTSRSRIPFAYAVSERLPGVPLGQGWDALSAAQRLSVYRHLGDCLGRMHFLTFAIFGDVAERAGGGVTVGPAHELADELTAPLDRGPFPTWREMHDRLVQRHLAFLGRTEFADLTAPIAAWFRRNDHLLDYVVTPRLLHMDLHAGNVLVDGGEVTGIVDVEESLVGHNEFDLMRTELAHFHADDAAAIRAAFFDAYTAHVPLDSAYEQRRPFYELSRSLVGLRCLVTFGDRYAPDHRSEVRVVRRRIADLLDMRPA
jgi:Ser/Thr protein kinase RdoA (MazF antagonist)